MGVVKPSTDTLTGTVGGVGVRSFSITREERQALWRREYERLMARPKEELVKLIIGEMPW